MGRGKFGGSSLASCGFAVEFGFSSRRRLRHRDFHRHDKRHSRAGSRRGLNFTASADLSEATPHVHQAVARGKAGGIAWRTVARGVWDESATFVLKLQR